MRDKLPISVFIITKNEEDRIGNTIQSVKKWVSEVLVIDSGSTDKTMEIARDLGAKTFFKDWEGYGPQKIHGESLCINDWILNIDADEEVSEKLQEEIIKLFEKGTPKVNAYKILIRVTSRFAKAPGLFSPAHFPIRLYNKNYAGFKESTVHDSVVLKKSGKVGKLKGIVYHRSFRSYSHALEKINRYSTMQAEDMFDKGRKPGFFRLLFEPIFGFLKGYFIKRYIFLGLDGFIEAVIYSFARTIRLAKARELFKAEAVNKEK